MNQHDEQTATASVDQQSEQSATSRARPAEIALHALFERIESRGMRGIETGFFELDDMTNGLQDAEFIVVGGRPAMGKSAFVSNIVEHVSVNTGLPVAVITFEMTEEQYMQRMLASRSQLDAHKLRKGMLKENQYVHLANVVGEIAKAPLFVSAKANIYIDDLCDLIRDIVLERGVKLVVIDYVQLIEAAGNSRTEQLTLVSGRLKALAMSLRIPVIGVSALNRGMFQPEAPRPRLEDLRGSGTLEDEADLVLLIHREDYYRNSEPDFVADNLVDVVIAKQRNGPTGTVKLTFMSKTTRFENLSTNDDPF